VRKINTSSKPAVDISDAGDPVLSPLLADDGNKNQRACCRAYLNKARSIYVAAAPRVPRWRIYELIQHSHCAFDKLIYSLFSTQGEHTLSPWQCEYCEFHNAPPAT